jgi:hypothetical protein
MERTSLSGRAVHESEPPEALESILTTLKLAEKLIRLTTYLCSSVFICG